MIAYLQGSIQQIEPDSLIVLTGGVGYQIFASKPTLRSVGGVGASIVLHIFTALREDSLSLYGFASRLEKELFVKLLQVSNIGPKLALGILSGLPAEPLISAIRKEDLLTLTAIPGVGKKTAERIVVELKDKLVSLSATAEPLTQSAEGPSLPVFSSLLEEAISALINLGYSRQEAQRSMQTVRNASELPLEVLVKEGLKALS